MGTGRTLQGDGSGRAHAWGHEEYHLLNEPQSLTLRIQAVRGTTTYSFQLLLFLNIMLYILPLAVIVLTSQRFCPVWIHVRRNSKLSKRISISKVEACTIGRVLLDLSHGNSEFLLMYIDNQNILVKYLEPFISICRLKIVI